MRTQVEVEVEVQIDLIDFPFILYGCVHAGNGKFVSHETNITYSGYWKDGLKDGLGSLFMPSGDVITGRWKEVRKRSALNRLNLII